MLLTTTEAVYPEFRIFFDLAVEFVSIYKHSGDDGAVVAVGAADDGGKAMWVHGWWRSSGDLFDYIDKKSTARHGNYLYDDDGRRMDGGGGLGIMKGRKKRNNNTGRE